MKPCKENLIYGVLNLPMKRGLILSSPTVTETIARLKVRQLFDQMTFATERSISFLKFSGFMEADNA
jgi:hypothetical protein